VIVEVDHRAAEHIAVDLCDGSRWRSAIRGRPREQPEGDIAQHCHALLKDSIRITQSDEDSGQLLVRFIGPGETLVTVALFTDPVYRPKPALWSTRLKSPGAKQTCGT
jgi:hypothetical protein